MIIAKVLSLILGSRTGANLIAVTVVGGGLFLWHKIDKSSAVRHAVAGYIADVELAAVNAELALLKKANAALNEANEQHEADLALAETLRTEQALELDAYVSTVDAFVDADLLGRLPNR
ncbi:MAG: hypothetical protein ABJQ71_05965 [Roseibium sp.]